MVFLSLSRYVIMGFMMHKRQPEPIKAGWFANSDRKHLMDDHEPGSNLEACCDGKQPKNIVILGDGLGVCKRIC